MITLENITLKQYSKVLLEKTSCTIFAKQKIGIIGKNGAGKTSLFSMLLGELPPEAGELYLAKQITFAHLAQEILPSAYGLTALEFVLAGDTKLTEINLALIKAEALNDGLKIASLHQKLHELDAYTAESRAAQLLVGLGFQNIELNKKVGEFSGGWRIRLNLAQALMAPSDILLLDEPTNHLDLDALIWLESWLNKYAGTLLIISHDRDFLDKVVAHILHFENHTLKMYNGNYSQFEKQRAAGLLQQQALYEKQQKQLAHMQSFINRFKAKASKAKQAQSRMKAIDRLELVAAVQTESPFQFEFKKSKQLPYPLLELRHASLAYDDRVILKKLNISLNPEDRITILGPNGAGKSSFIKLLAGELPLKSGESLAHPGLKIGYFAQHQVDHLVLTESALMHLQKLSPECKEIELRTFLGGFDFRGDVVHMPIAQFSGGEKSRLALALIVWQAPNLLLLDEPTNHLDLEMRQALTLALQEYEGAMILVSHDRFLIRSTTNKLMLIADHTLQNFDEDIDAYQEWLVEYAQKNNTNPEESKKISSQNTHEQSKAHVQQINKLESAMQKINKELNILQEQLEDPHLYSFEKQTELKNLLVQQEKLKKTLTKCEEEWLSISQKKI